MGALVEVSLDLDEYSKSLGMGLHNARHGCKACWTTDYNDFHTEQEPRCQDDFVKCVKEALFFFDITEPVARLVVEGSKSTRKKAGLHLKKAFAGLLRGDRIEPAPVCLEDFVFPRPDGARVVEHPSSQVLVYRRGVNRWSKNLVWVTRLVEVEGIIQGIPGLTWKHFLFDYMHVVDLGIILYVNAASLRRLLDAGFFGDLNEDVEPDAIDLAFSQSVSLYFDDKQVERKDRVSVTLNNLGPKERPYLACKAGPAKLVLGWVTDLLVNKGGAEAINGIASLPGEGSALKECCVGLAGLYKVLKDAPRTMTRQELDTAEAHALKVCSQWKRSGRTAKLKFHILARHFREQCEWSGNPLFSHNYREETLNFSSRVMGHSVSRISFSKRFLAKWLLAYFNNGLKEI